MIMQTNPQFIQPCPICGRPLRIETKYAGQRVTCHHCRGQFMAIRHAGCEAAQGEPYERPRPETPTVLVVEYRDEVYQRLAGNLCHAGCRVMRAFCASEGIIQSLMFRPDIVIANVDLPDQSGWLLTAKLCATEPRPHIWLYKSEASRMDAVKARFLGAEELLAYQSLQELSSAVFASLAGDALSLRSEGIQTLTRR
jgi:PleD family two-component response regulator